MEKETHKSCLYKIDYSMVDKKEINTDKIKTIKFNLFAIICLRDNDKNKTDYAAFLKTGSDENSPWVYYYNDGKN
jgi:hypothetical protein